MPQIHMYACMHACTYVWSGCESIKSPKGFVTWKWNGNHIIISRNQCLMCVCAMLIRRSRCLLSLLLLLLLAYTQNNVCTQNTWTTRFFFLFDEFRSLPRIHLCGKGCTLEPMWWWCCVLYMAPLKCDEYWAPFRLCANTFFSFSLHTYKHVCVCAIRFVWHCMFFCYLSFSLVRLVFLFLVRSSFLTVSTAYSRTTNRQVVICYSCCFDANRNFSIYSR